MIVKVSYIKIVFYVFHKNEILQGTKGHWPTRTDRARLQPATLSSLWRLGLAGLAIACNMPTKLDGVRVTQSRLACVNRVP